MQTKVSIPGIHCNGCAALIKDVSSEFPAVTSVDVNVDTKNVTIEHDDTFNRQAWQEEVESLDEKYKVLPIT